MGRIGAFLLGECFVAAAYETDLCGLLDVKLGHNVLGRKNGLRLAERVIVSEGESLVREIYMKR